MSAGAALGAAMVLGGALSVLGCGGGGDTAPIAQSRAVPPPAEQRELDLTTELPETVRRACERLARGMSGTLFCPPLVPAGDASEQYAGRREDRRTGDAPRTYVLDFASRSLGRLGGKDVDANGGHWVVEGVGREVLRSEVGLYVPRRQRRGRVRMTATRIAGRPVRLYRSGAACCFEAYLAGHYTATWRRRGRTYAVSIHGYRNRPRVLAMARALIDLQDRCDRRPRPAEGWELAMEGGR